MKDNSTQDIRIGQAMFKKLNPDILGSFIRINGELFYKIDHYDKMAPFFMTIVGPYDQWMFISSNGGLTAGRKNSDSAIFPYDTEDKITANAEFTGSKTIIKVRIKGELAWSLWEPFSDKYLGVYDISRNIYKNKSGNKLIFEEINKDLDISFQYQWSFSNEYGFVKKSEVINNSKSELEINLLDGLENILPPEIGEELQRSRSSLVDAYKKNDLLIKEQIGVFGLGALIVDRAEPSESLKASTVWSSAQNVVNFLLSSSQLHKFREGLAIENENFSLGKKGAFFVELDLKLNPSDSANWLTVAEVNQSAARLENLKRFINSTNDVEDVVLLDIEKSTERLRKFVGLADGIQKSNDKKTEVRHYFNVLFNIMRGGLFETSYQIQKANLLRTIKHYNHKAFEKNSRFLNSLDSNFSYKELLLEVKKHGDEDLIRLSSQHLPLSFSRRHGDPSRPWNKFFIDIQDQYHNRRLSYEGNWRDIFQNWEALAYSYPEFIEGMIAKFLNASTIDGYNPYRISHLGIDWEEIEPDDPWSYIGYWGDHQIIYLLKLLEHCEKHFPSRLSSKLNSREYVYSNVPYRIKSYQDILTDPRDTIEYDDQLEDVIAIRVNEIGEDGKLVYDARMKPIRASLSEKLLVSLLAKLSNFIPDAGIWLNTQRPEWNDANNALVGNGTSIVTTAHIRRFLSFFKELLTKSAEEKLSIQADVWNLFDEIRNSYKRFDAALESGFDPHARKEFADSQGLAAQKYREEMYLRPRNELKTLSKIELLQFIDHSLKFIDSTLENNRREDGLFHSYNLIEISEQEIEVDYLYEMLEGQVALIDSGFLKSSEVVSLLNSLKISKLYREDQRSYMLYPDRKLTPFFLKNRIPQTYISKSFLLQKLLEDGNIELIKLDANKDLHFNSSITNARILNTVLDELSIHYKNLVIKERELISDLYESLFKHKTFTGRSGTFFAYEGLGSIYWHMVSKLQLAVQSHLNLPLDSRDSEADLLRHVDEIKEGIGAGKTPVEYGAFPTDPYSHTPKDSGVRQPGMTGQVKEDVLSRWLELGVKVNNGQIKFEPIHIKPEEFYSEPVEFEYYDINGEVNVILVQASSMAFTYAGIPIVYVQGDGNCIEVLLKDGQLKKIEGNNLGSEMSQSIFSREGKIKKIIVNI